MARFTNLGNIFKTLREANLSAIRQSAERPLHLAVIGEAGAGKTTLIQQMRHGAREQEQFPSVVSEIELPDLPGFQNLAGLTAAILVLDASQPTPEATQPAVDRMRSQGVPLLIALNKADLMAGDHETLLSDWQGRMPAEVVLMSALQHADIINILIPALLRLIPGYGLALARALPVFRQPVSHRLIQETAVTNAGYSLTTGLAEIVPILDVPFNLADMVMLTKNQALMAYKIALAMGLPPDWRETLPQLAAVVGGGFLWRQIARGLVGLIPGWGIIPKVAVAYAGTRVTGIAIYHWAATGEKLSPRALNQLYRQALDQGRELARRLIARRRERPALASRRNCPACGRRVPADAAFCPYCGSALAPALPAPGTPQ